MSLLLDLIGTSKPYFKIGKGGVRLQNSSGNLLIRNADDSADTVILPQSLGVGVRDDTKYLRDDGEWTLPQFNLGNSVVAIGSTLLALSGVSINASANTLSNIGNGSLQNSSLTLGSTSVSLGSTVTNIAGLTLASPTLITPALGIPASGVLTNCSGLPIAGVSGLGSGIASFLATPSSANLIAAISDETGSGSLVFGTSPTITTPIISGGTLDNSAIGATTPNTGAFTTLSTSDISTITVNSASSALTITQSGGGNCLTINDVTGDTSPFIIDAGGNVVAGYTSTLTSSILGTTVSGKIQTIGTTNNSSGNGAYVYSNTTVGAVYYGSKSRSAVIGTPGATAANDSFVSLIGAGDDGTGFFEAGRVQILGDGAASTGSVPGAVRFMTTPSGAVVPVEAGRFSSTGAFGLGTTSLTGYNCRISKNITGSTTSYGIRNDGQIQSDVTTARVNYTQTSTAAASFTVTNIYGYFISQGTFGAGSSVTSQAGFFVENTLTGATNNYGFRGQIASGTGRYNLYMDGSADNYLGGATNISVSSSSDALRVTQAGTGNAFVVEDSANPDATPFLIDFAGNLVMGNTAPIPLVNPSTGASNTPVSQVVGTAIASTSCGNALYVNNASQAGSYTFAKTKGATVGDMTTVVSGDTIGYLSWQASDGTSFQRLADINAQVDGTPAAGSMPGRIVFRTSPDTTTSPTVKMTISNSGGVIVGSSSTAIPTSNLAVSKTITGGTTTTAINQTGIVQSDVTTANYGFRNTAQTIAAAFTLTSLYGFQAQQSTIGAASVITSQYGFSANSNLTGAANNYGFHSDIASSSGRWNYYASGTANNAFNGNSSFGKVTTPIASVDCTSLAANLVTNAAGTYTVLSSDHTIIQTTAGSTYTLPAASSFTNRILHLVTQFAGAVISASSNVVPIAGGAAGTAILAATAGKFARLQSNGTNWVIIAAN